MAVFVHKYVIIEVRKFLKHPARSQSAAEEPEDCMLQSASMTVGVRVW
jgi:hypothetical protein